MKPGNKWRFAAWGGLMGGVLALFLSAGALSGQTFEQRVDDIVSRARFRFGPFRFYPRLEFSQFGWISNIYGQAQAEHPTSDFVIAPSPKLYIYLILRRRLILSFTENPEYRFYLKHHEYNRWANSYRAELAFPFFASLIISAGYFSQSQRSWSLAEVDRQVDALAQGLRADVSYETGRRLSFSLTAMFSRLAYKDVLAAPGSPDLLALNLDREETSGLAEVRWQVFSSSNLFVRGGYARYNFRGEEAGWRDSQSTHFLFGFRLASPGRLSGNLAAGLRRFLSRQGTAKSYSGLIADAQISYRLGVATSLSLGYNRDLMFSFWANTLYYINDGFNGSLIVKLGRFLDLRFVASYSLLHYSGQREGDFSEAGPQPGRTDRFLNLSAGFSVPVFRGVRAGLSYHYWARPEGFPDKRHGNLVAFDLFYQ